MSVAIILASLSDKPVAEKATAVLKELGVPYTVSIASAHRTPERLARLVAESMASVFIAVAGLSAALPGAVAALTQKPVIGVPVSGPLNMDALLAIVQMPPGVPVAAVGLDRGDNAALLAARIIGLNDKKVQAALEAYRKKQAAKIEGDAKQVESL